jgi:hypothetical protein
MSSHILRVCQILLPRHIRPWRALSILRRIYGGCRVHFLHYHLSQQIQISVGNIQALTLILILLRRNPLHLRATCGQLPVRIIPSGRIIRNIADRFQKAACMLPLQISNARNATISLDLARYRHHFFRNTSAVTAEKVSTGPVVSRSVLVVPSHALVDTRI